MNILMTLMGLEIGGAETHVVELATELKRRGHHVSVASNGGVYVAELEKLDIPHYKLPLHSKRLGNMLASYKGLKKIIQENSFDLVHAHARIPGFICGLLQKRLRFRFITSTHWVFKTGPLLNLMTNWGERTVAVSEDIKQYLIDNYRMPADRITVTINGIDTVKFSPEATPEGVEEEFGLDAGRRRIVYISRMDTDRSAVAFQLLELMPALKERYPNVELVIVGGGNDFARLEKQVEQTNRELGCRAVIAAGPRTDINNFVAAADVFVGVSRSALEAMAAAKPVIIAGNEGYIGIYQPDKLDIALQTNFCCRGCQPSTPQLLLRDLCSLLDADPEQLALSRDYNRQTILDRYSVSKMTDDYLSAYDALLAHNPYRPKDVLISGYYGYQNTGDDSLLESIVANLKAHKPDVSVTVLSARPGETSRIYGVKSIYRFNIPKILHTMKRTKLLISGGGSLIQDITSTKSLYYYLSVIRFAKAYGMKVMMYANGIGPINLSKNRALCTDVLNRATVISLREENSKEELLRLGVTRPPMVVSADPAFALQPSPAERISRIWEEEKLSSDAVYFAVSLREWKQASPSFERDVAQVCDYVSSRYGLTPLFIPMQGNLDRPICRRVRGMLTCKSELLKQSYNAKDLMGMVRQCRFVLGMRLHILIYALSMGVPVAGLSYDPKIDAMLRQFHQTAGSAVASFQPQALKEYIDKLMEHREAVSTELRQIAAVMRTKTEEDAQTATNLLLF